MTSPARCCIGSLHMRGRSRCCGGSNLMVGVPVVGVATLRCAVADRLAHIVFVDIDDVSCAVLHRIAAHEGEVSVLWRIELNGGGTRRWSSDVALRRRWSTGAHWFRCYP